MAILFFTVVIDLIGFGIIIPILPFMAPKLGASSADIFWITALYSLGTVLFNPFWGKLSDRIGRKPVLLICLAGACLSYIWLALASSLLAVYLSRLFAGIMAGNFSVASAMVADMTDEKNRARGMGQIGAAFGLGMTIGPAIGGFMAGEEVNFVMPALFAAGLSATAIVLGLIFLREPQTAEQRRQHQQTAKSEGLSLWGMLQRTGNTLLASQYFLHSFCISLITIMFPIWVGALLGWSPREVGIVISVQGIGMAMVQGTLIGPMTRIMGEYGFLIVGVLLLIAGCALATIADIMPLMVTAFFMAITGATFCVPVLNSITSQRTPPQYRGRMLGTTSSMGALGRVVGPAVGALVIDSLGFSGTWWLLVAVGVIYLLWPVWQWRQLQLQAAQ